MWRLLWECTDRKALQHLGIALLLVAAAGLLAGLAPLALKSLVETVTAPPADPSDPLAWTAAAWATAYVLALSSARLLAEFRPLVAGHAEQRICARITERSFSHLLSLPMAFHDRQATGATVQALVQASQGSQIVTGHGMGTVVPVTIELLTAVAVLLTLGRQEIVVTFLMTALAYVWVYARGGPLLCESASAVSAASVGLHSHVVDGLMHAEVLKTFGGERAASQRVTAASEQLQSAWAGLYRRRARTGLAAACVFTLCLAATVALALRGLAQGALSAGGFVLITVYMLQMVRPLEALGTATSDLAQARGFLRPMLTLLRALPEVGTGPCLSPDSLDASEPQGSTPDQPAPASGSSPSASSAAGTPHTRSSRRPPLIRLDSLTFGYYRHSPVLRDIDLEIRTGESVALVGSTGSGKSSVAKLLLRLYEPQRGRILLDGRPARATAPGEWRDAMSLVPQECALFNDSIAGNITLGSPRATRGEIERVARIACLDGWIAALPLGYDTQVGERGLRLSGGERQRIAIARALLRRPRLLILDEPTSMLDGPTEAVVVQRLREASRDCATLTIAHRLPTIIQVDRIVVLDAGRIVEMGTHSQLLARSGAYARQWACCARAGMP